MKGTTFLKPLEFILEAIGEKWSQGDKIKGSLKIRNHSGDNITLPLVKIMLAEGNYKKIKAKDAKAFSKIEESDVGSNIALLGNEEKEFPFEFKISETSSITDKNGSLYLAFFDKDDTQPASHIELVIEPRPVIKQTLEIIENFIRFKVKEMKSVKGMVEVKLMPPSSREMSNIDSLILSLSEKDKTLTLKYAFNLRGIDMSSGTMQTQKKTKDFEQVFTSKQYMIYGDSLNQDFIIASLQSILAEVKPKLL